MFNKILKKLLLRFVTNFLYISTVFFTCTPFFEFNYISVAKASPNTVQTSRKNTEVISSSLDLGMLTNKLPEPRTQFFDKDGKPHLLKEYKNKFIILYLWASWCTDCLNELAKLDLLAGELEYREISDLVIIPITIDFKPPEQLDKYLKQKGIENISFFIDPKKEIMGELGAYSLPRSFLINQEGFIIATYNHSMDWSSNVITEKLLKLKQLNKAVFKSSINETKQDTAAKGDDKAKSNSIILQENLEKTEKQPTFIG